MCSELLIEASFVQSCNSVNAIILPLHSHSTRYSVVEILRKLSNGLPALLAQQEALTRLRPFGVLACMSLSYVCLLPNYPIKDIPVASKSSNFLPFVASNVVDLSENLFTQR